MNDFEDEESEFLDDFDTFYPLLDCVIDLSATSTLQFPKIESKKTVEVDFGIFSKQWKGFHHEGYFRSSLFSLEKLLEESSDNIAGILLGRFDLTDDFELHDTLIRYLEQFAAVIPEKSFVLFDSKNIKDPAVFSRLIQKDRFDAFRPAIQNAPFQTDTLLLENISFIEPDFMPDVGVVVPTYTTRNAPGLDQELKRLINSKIDFKIIPETHITTEWDGIDELIVCLETISETTKRMLDGFVATGGNFRHLSKL